MTPSQAYLEAKKREMDALREAFAAELSEHLAAHEAATHWWFDLPWYQRAWYRFRWLASRVRVRVARWVAGDSWPGDEW